MDENGNNYMANCGMFWITNSIMSAVMNFTNQELRDKANERNEEFQLELERARTETQIEMEAEKIAFKRRMMTLSRQNRLKQSVITYNQQLEKIELQAFIGKYWPLSQSVPYSLITEVQRAGEQQKELPLNVILLHSPLLPTRMTLAGKEIPNPGDKRLYEQIEEIILTEDIPIISNKHGNNVDEELIFRKDSCETTDFIGGNTNMMNIHFLMSPIPTLVVSPRYHEGKVYFNSAVWEAQAARPIMRPLFSIDYELYVEKNEDEKRQVIDLFRAAYSTIIGTARDSYQVLVKGKKPTFNLLMDKNSIIKQFVMGNENIHQFVRQEYLNMLNALDVNKTPRLLEVLEEADVKYMQREIQNMNLLLA